MEGLSIHAQPYRGNDRQAESRHTRIYHKLSPGLSVSPTGSAGSLVQHVPVMQCPLEGTDHGPQNQQGEAHIRTLSQQTRSGGQASRDRIDPGMEQRTRPVWRYTPPNTSPTEKA